MSHRAFLLVMLLAGAVLVLVSCAPPTPTPAPATAVAEAAQVAEAAKSQFALAGTEWQLESMFAPEASISVVPGTYPSLGFGVERYTGYGGCDWFGGVYTAQGDTLRLQAPATTRGGCVTEPRAAEQQATYMSMLWNVTNYAVEDGKLVLYTVNNQHLMTMAPLTAVPFEGTVWELTFYFSPDSAYWAPLLPGAAITATFDGQQLTGNAGCNDYTADYKRNGNRLTLGKLTVTDKTCTAPEDVMDQEHGYLSMLESVGVIRQYPRSIELLTSGGMPRLMYHARPGATP